MSTSNSQISSEGLQQANTLRTEYNVLQAANSAEPGALQPYTEIAASSSSSHPQQNIGTAEQSNGSTSIQSVTDVGADLGSQIQNLRIAEPDLRLRNTDIDLAPVINVHRSEDELLVIQMTSPDRERPTVITLRNIRSFEAVNVEFIRGDTTQAEARASLNNGVSQDSVPASVINQPIQSSQEAVADDPIISGRSLGPESNSVDDAEGDEVSLAGRTSRPYEVSFNRERQVDTHSGTITLPSPNAQGEEGSHCSVWFEIMTTLSTLMPCGHEFDADCIMPWLQTLILENYPRRRNLSCPLCRRSALVMRHSYSPQGEYQILYIDDLIRDPSHYFTSARDLESLISRGRTFRDRQGALIGFMDPNHDRLFLDMERINSMGPHELEEFISNIHSFPSQVDWGRLTASQGPMLVDRIWMFRSLSSDGPLTRVSFFPGYNSDDTLNINEISRMSRQYLVRFRDVLDTLGEFEKLSAPDIEAFQQICEATRLDNIHEDGTQAISER